MPTTWGNYELVNEDEQPGKPDYTSLAREMTRPKQPITAPRDAPAAPVVAEQSRYRPGGLLGRAFSSLFGPLVSDETVMRIDNYQGFDPNTATGVAEPLPLERGNYADMGLRSVARVPDLAGNLIDLVPNTREAMLRAFGIEPGPVSEIIRAGLRPISQAAHEPARIANELGLGLPSVDASQALDAADPTTDIGFLDRAQTLGKFIPESLAGSGGDMAVAVAAPWAYMGARTNEIAANRAGNDQRQDVSVGDLGVAAPAAAIETLLERLTTGRLLPGGAARAPATTLGEAVSRVAKETGLQPATTLGEAVSRVAKETGLQSASGGVEELVPYLAETVGTQKGANGRDAAAQAFGGALSEGALGAAVEAPREMASLQRERMRTRAEIAQQAAAPSLPSAPAAVDASNFEVIQAPPAAAPASQPAAITAVPAEAQPLPAPPAPAASSVEKQEVAPANASPSPPPDQGKINIAPQAVGTNSAPAAPAQKPASTPVPKKPADLLETIAARGGLNLEAFQRQGVDPAEFTRRAGFNYVFRKKGGMTPDTLREFLQQDGYLPRDPEGAPPVVDDNAAYDLVDRALRGGERIYSESQAADVAAYKEARRKADDEYRAELLAQPEFAAPPDAGENYDPFANDPIAAEFAQRIADLTEEAYSLGVSESEIIGAAFDASVAGDHIVALEDLITRRKDVRAEPDTAANDGNTPRSAVPRETPASPDGFRLEEPSAAAGGENSGRQIAPSAAQGGLFAPPTTREMVRAREQQTDAQRNGLGRDFVSASSGGGELFAGGRPDQARIDQPADPAPKLTSLKNAVTDSERASENRDPIIASARQSNRDTVDAALSQVRENPRIGSETAARLAAGGKASLQDEAVLLVHKVDLRKRRDAAADRAQDTSASDEARDIARREYDDLVQQIDEVDQAAKRVGTESGRLLQLRRRMIAEDYTLPALERRLAMAVDRPITDSERGELRKMADKVAELERKLGDAERAAAQTQVAELLAKLMASSPGRSASLAERRAAAAESRASLLAARSDPKTDGNLPEQPEVRAALDASLASGRAGNLMRRLADAQGLREEQRDLARRLAPVLEQLDVGLVAAPEGARYAGLYDSGDNTIWVFQADADTVLHEGVHGVTSALMTSAQAKTNPDVKRVVREFEEMLDHLRMQVAMELVNVPSDVRKLLDDRQGPLSNVKELLSYGMTEKPLQEWLATLPPPPGREQARNLWKSFKDAVSRLLARVTGAKRSYLDALIESGGELIDIAGRNPEVARGAQRDVAARWRAVDPAQVRQKTETDVPTGIDPVAFFHLVRMGAFHVADGGRDQQEWTRRMEADLGAAAGQYRAALPAVYTAAKAQVAKARGDVETVAEALAAIGDKRRPRDVKRVVRAIVGEGMRGEQEVMQEAGRVLGLDDDAVRDLFVQSEGRPMTETDARRELKDLRKLVAMQEEIDRLQAGMPKAARAAGKDSPAVAKRRAALEALRAQMREAGRPDEETRYQDLRGRDLQRRIAELEERIRSGDFAKRTRTERELTAENQRLRYELEATRERFHRFAIEAEFNSRTPIGKLFGNTVAGVNFARAIMTSLDLSAVLRQGGFISLGRPSRAIRAFPGSIRAALSERADFELRQSIENRPNAPLYRKYGLELTSIGGDALTRTEEAYASRWVDKIPSALGGGLIRGSGRAYTAFLNRLRADSFDAMVAALARKGDAPTPDEGKAIANYINVATGRGRVGKNEAAGEVLNTVFFAPRLVASRFQLLAGQPLYGGSARTRAMIVHEYARFMIGASIAVALAMMMRDDQDETKAIELDPRSANFGKVRFGETFVDPLVGLAQVTVFLARVATGETRTTTTDALRPLRNGYRLTDIAPGLGDGAPLGKVRYGGRDIPDVITAFLRSKLAPVPGAIVNLAAGENMIGEPVTLGGAAVELVTPMSVSNIVDVMESQGMARGTAINLLGLLGMSVQYRKSDAERAAEKANGVPGLLNVGRAPGARDGE